MKLFYKPQAIKQISKLPRSEQKKIIHKLEFLVKEATVGKSLKGELEGLYSLRAWPYRIIYSKTKDKIIIYSIAHRQSVYKSEESSL